MATWSGGKTIEIPGFALVTRVALAKSANFSDDQISHLRHLEGGNRYL